METKSEIRHRQGLPPTGLDNRRVRRQVDLCLAR